MHLLRCTQHQADITGAFIKMQVLRLNIHQREYGKFESAVMHWSTGEHLYILYICIYLSYMSNWETNAQDMKS